MNPAPEVNVVIEPVLGPVPLAGSQVEPLPAPDTPHSVPTPILPEAAIPSRAFLSLIPHEFARRHLILSAGSEGTSPVEVEHLLITERTSPAAVYNVGVTLQRAVRTSLGSPESIAAAIDRVYLAADEDVPIAHTRRVVSTAPGARRPESVTEVHDGLHEPIIPLALWDKVHEMMKVATRDTTTRWTHTHLLKGKLRTFEGHTMSPSSTQPKRDDEPGDRSRRIVRYYVSQKAVKHGYAACPIKSLIRHASRHTRARRPTGTPKSCW